MKFSDGWIIIYYAIALISKKLNFGINTYNFLYSNYILRYYERGKGEGGNCISLKICLSGKISIIEITVISNCFRLASMLMLC